jgi:hypothetical protein
MHIHHSIRQMVLIVVLALMSWFSAPVAQAAESAQEVRVPEILGAQPAGAMGLPVGAPLAANWVGELKNALNMYKAKYPTSNFDAYAQKLSLVEGAVSRGDRRAVKTEMGAFFKMLGKRAKGIDEAAADELSNYAQMVTPVREYGISVPRSGAGQYEADVPSSGSAVQ